eukprot:m.642714 g.642714  ORF g.642714 m.642714 type:complete len:73 (-) comp22641_c0_seq15:1182-1400(-)
MTHTDNNDDANGISQKCATEMNSETPTSPCAKKCSANPAVRFFEGLGTPWLWLGSQVGLVSKERVKRAPWLW